MSQERYPFTTTSGRSATTLLFPPSFFANAADTSSDRRTNGTDKRVPRCATPLANVTQSMLSAPEETSEEEAERLREENERLRVELKQLGHAVESKWAMTHTWLAPADARTAELLECKLKLLEGEKEELLARTLNAEQSFLSLHQQHKVEVDSLRTECERLVLSLKEQYQNAVDQAHQQCQGLAEQLGRIQRVKEGLHQQLREKEQEWQFSTSELTESIKLREIDLAAMRKDLSQQEDHVSALQRELETKGVHIQSVEGCLVEEKRKVELLQAYAGVSTVDDLTNEMSVVTWQQEQDQMQQQNQYLQEENSRLSVELELVKVRADSLDQIMALQETELAKASCKEEGGGKSLSSSQISSLLAGWREKVFEQLIKLKLFQIEQDRMKHAFAKKEQFFNEEVQKFSQEKEVLSLALKAEEADKQLQIQKTQEAMVISNHTLAQKAKLEGWLYSQQTLLQNIRQNVREMGMVPGRMEALVRDVISPRLIITESRLARNGRRLQAIIASLNSWYVMQKNPAIPLTPMCHMTTQTDDIPLESRTEMTDVVAMETYDLDSMPVEQLAHECRVLMKERDLLTKRLTEATAAFQQQLKAGREEDTGRISVLQQRVERLSCERTSLSEQLSQCRSQLEEASAVTTRLQEQCLLMEEQLREIREESDNAIQKAVREEQQRGAEECIKLEQCIEVARREQSKMASELQQVQRRAERETERAVQAVTIGKEQVEYELDVCRRKLHSLQVERNLLMSTLRQEGIKLGHASGRLAPVKPLTFSLTPPPQENSESDTEGDSSSEEGDVDLSLSRSAPRLLRWTHPQPVSPPLPSTMQAHLPPVAHTLCSPPSTHPSSQHSEVEEEENKENICTDGHAEERFKPSPIHPQVEKEKELGRVVKTAIGDRNHQQSLMTAQGMHEVLKDLHQLSAALLSMDSST